MMDRFLDLKTLTIQTFDDSGGKEVTPRIFSFDQKLIEDANGAGAGIFWSINPQEDTNARGVDNTREFKRLGLDLDVAKEKQGFSSEEIARKKAELKNKLNNLEIPPNYIIETKNGLQPFWIFKAGKQLNTVDERREANELYKQLVVGFAKVTGLKSEGDNISRVLRLPGTKHLKTTSDPFKITIEEVDLNPVDFNDFIKAYPPVVEANGTGPRLSVTDAIGLHEGEGRNQTLHDLACSFILRDGAEKAWVAIQAINQTGDPLTGSELKTLFKSAEAWISKQTSFNAHTARLENEKVNWPAPLATEAFIGPLGALAKAIEPESEADPASLITNFLTAFGNIVGDSPYINISVTKHPARLFICHVGSTSEGAKGEGWSYVPWLFGKIDESWVKNNLVKGFGSGEALVAAVRDEQWEEKTIKGITENILVDPGITDKRALFLQPEFSATLKIMSRDGNILSDRLREAWETGNLQNRVKKETMVATGAHISLVAHITPNELHRYLADTELSNGFSNRFLWICVRSSKDLPRGGTIDEAAITPIINEIKNAVEFAKNVNEVTLSESAWTIYEHIYSDLKKRPPNLFGDVTTRARPYVLRLALIYCLSTCQKVIQPEHLQAALAVWDYVEASVHCIFKTATSDPVANRIYEAIKKNGELTQTEINGLFSRNQTAERIYDALSTLEKAGLILQKIELGSGRKTTVWYLAQET